MKKNLNTIKDGVIFGFTALIIFCLGVYIFLKARNSSVSGLPTDTTNPSALYVNSNETLTAAKRNTLVSQTVKKKIYCSKSNGTLTTTAAGSQTYTFVASDCGGELPDSNYIGVAGDMWVPGTYIYNFTTNFCGTNCVRFYHASGASGTFNVSVTYFQK